MVNALRHAEGEWGREVEELLDGVEGPERLPALAWWMCTTTSEDLVMRRLLAEIVSAGPGPGREADQVRSTARAHRESLEEFVVGAGIAEPGIAADMLHLLFRGYWLAMLEDPEGWPTERGAQAALALIGLLGGDAPQAGPDRP